MSKTRHRTETTALRGWRQRAWAWVLFVALFKGLVPHAALAGVLMSGDPAAVWCSPVTQASQATEGKVTAEMAAGSHSCVCASASDALLPAFGDDAHPSASVALRVVVPPPALVQAEGPVPPPARGPPQS